MKETGEGVSGGVRGGERKEAVAFPAATGERVVSFHLLDVQSYGSDRELRGAPRVPQN